MTRALISQFRRVNLLALIAACLGISANGPAQITMVPAQPSVVRELSLQAEHLATDISLPLERGSVRFAVIGDSGTGEHEQYEVAEMMAALQSKVNFDFVIMLGDNIYGGHTPKDFREKFEMPYRPLVDRGVKFYACLGNHDDPKLEPLYKPFNMNGQRYYTFKKGDAEFFVLDSNYMDPAQLQWLEKSLGESKSKWKICYFHHPLYSAGKHHGADVDLRGRILPLFERYKVNVVFSGHEHVYERMKPHEGMNFFVLGNSGKLMVNDIASASDLESGFDTDRGFMVVEIAGDKLYYQTISRAGRTIDQGSVPR